MTEKNLTTAQMEERVKFLEAQIAQKRQNDAVKSRGYHHSPYPAPPYRGGRGRGYNRGAQPQYRNRTLHVQNSQPASAETTDGESTESWVSKQDRHLQLINKTVYDKMQENAANNAGLPATFAATPKTAPPPPKAPIKTDLCRTFCHTGQCRKGSTCNFIHDPSKVAICKEYLAKGTCHKASRCDLSHDSTPHRVPPCSFFLRGNCTNDNCRYPHYTTNTDAQICVDFVTLGYCDKGVNCTARHEIECPEYSSKGSCSNPKCRLPHIDHAGQIRQRNQDQDKDKDKKQNLEPVPTVSGEALLDNFEAMLSQNETRKMSKSSSPDPNGQFSQQDNFLSLEVDPDGSFEKRFGQ